MDPLESLVKHKLIVAITFFGLGAFYFWQPISELVNGNFNQNIVLQLDSDTFKQDKGNQLLVIHVKPINRGNVPVEIGNKDHPGSFKLEA